MEVTATAAASNYKVFDGILIGRPVKIRNANFPAHGNTSSYTIVFGKRDRRTSAKFTLNIKKRQLTTCRKCH
jgi:hypothetical protein